MNTSPRGTPLSRNPCPTLPSLPYACAVSMCRYPSSSAQRTASTHSRSFSTCQTPRPTSGISFPSASTRALPSAVTTSADIAPLFWSSNLVVQTLPGADLFPRAISTLPTSQAAAGCREERADVGGELDVLLERQPCGESG